MAPHRLFPDTPPKENLQTKELILKDQHISLEADCHIYRDQFARMKGMNPNFDMTQALHKFEIGVQGPNPIFFACDSVELIFKRI